MASGQEDKPKSDYILGRNLVSRIRLNHQHFTNAKIFGYLLHPTVPHDKPDLQVADLGTGSGIWLFDAAAQFPPSTQFYGFDISLDQVPPRGPWIPANFHFDTLDLNQDVPEHLHAKFDIINIRFLVLIIKDNPIELLRKALLMLKPGGWLQWCEVTLTQETVSTLLHADTRVAGEGMVEMNNRTRVNREGYFGEWVPTLDDYFRGQGLEQVVKDLRKPEDYPLWLAFANDTTTAAYGEFFSALGEGEVRDGLLDVYRRAAGESWKGTYWGAARLNVVGRKPT